ncbi:hypothetical protein CEE37_02770 [candidate division LCP-89 bacterium B3_LCP]|uniref:Exo-alpha-sialidase n=1 Tax=candidate division LCP-89 bacterium B3_LCP TaxID=2012998 RepID=A0A532V2Z4_UNCL8|nr:MAG: hypothetical protein CEE37_02770 [candidate division LCP-89 bacterium B3_LCP]
MLRQVLDAEGGCDLTQVNKTGGIMKHLIISLTLMTLIPVFSFASTKPLKTPMVNYPVMTGNEVYPGSPKSTPPLLLDNLDVIGEIDTIGTTWVKIQHNGTIGRMIERSTDGYTDFVWMNGLDYGVINRHIYYNFIDPLGVQAWPGGYPVESSQRAGYTTMDVDFNGIAFPAFHWTNTPGGDFWTAVATDFFAHTGTFITYETLPYAGVDKIIWPKVQFDRNQVLQIVSTENPGGFESYRHFYTTGTYNPLTYSIVYEPWEEMTWTMTIAGDVAASDISDRVAYGWTYCRDDGFPAPGGDYSQYNNDIHILIDDDGLDPDWSQAVNLTDFIPPIPFWPPFTQNGDTLRAYTDMSLFFDQDDYLHVAFTTPSYFEIQGIMYWHASIIWHWTEQYPDEFVMIHNAFDDFWWNTVDCGTWNVKAQRPSLAQDPSTGYLYCSYQVFDCDTNAISAGDLPSGEVFVSVSTDGGMNWALGTNITQTVTPDNGAPGSCFNEICPNMAKLVDGTCHIMYVMDHDAADPYR